MNHFTLKLKRKTSFLLVLAFTTFSLFLLLNPMEILPNEGNGYFLCLLLSISLFVLPFVFIVKDAIPKRLYISLLLYSILFFTTRFFVSLSIIYPVFQDKSLLIAWFIFPGLIFLLTHLADQMYFYPLMKKYQVENEKNDDLPSLISLVFLLVTGILLPYQALVTSSVLWIEGIWIVAIYGQFFLYFILQKKLMDERQLMKISIEGIENRTQIVHSLLQDITKIQYVDQGRKEQLKQVQLIRSLLNKNHISIGSLEDYFNKLEHVLEGAIILSYCPNQAINAFLSRYENTFFKEEIDFKYHLDIPRILPFNELDFCLLLGKILDRAILSCSKLKKEKVILLCVTSLKDEWTIKCECSTPKDFTVEEGHLISFSEDLTFDEFSTKTLEDVVKKYKGKFHLEKNDVRLLMNLTLYPKKKGTTEESVEKKWENVTLESSDIKASSNEENN